MWRTLYKATASLCDVVTLFICLLVYNITYVVTLFDMFNVTKRQATRVLMNMTVDAALMEARLRAYYAAYNPENDQNMCVVHWHFTQPLSARIRVLLWLM